MSETKLKPSWRNILVALANANGALLSQRDLPDGNGRAKEARGDTLRALSKAGLIEVGKEDIPSFMGRVFPPKHGFKITPRGLAALSKASGNGE